MSDLSPGLEPIAIVGMALRVPGAEEPETLWRNLMAGVESITRLTEADLRAAGVGQAALADPRYVRAGAFLEGIERFDAGFFGLTPREAEVLDPAARLFLEVAWEALERAGHDPRAVPGRVAVYAGAGQSTYLIHHLLPRRDLIRALGGFEVSMGTDKDFVPTRVSYKLGLTGPSVGVNTACSTSLVAVHLACQGLWTYQSDVALAGGATVRVPQGTGYLYQEGGIASPDGHCRAFDARAQGTVEANGAGVVALKRLADALRDGNPVHAVIRGAAVNNDGEAKVGFTAPGVDGQAGVVAEALALAGVPADSIGYVEAHGTGTPLGDPVEVEALTRAFRATTTRTGFCALGSIKTNLGHLDTAAGVVGLIKAALALQHRALPPSLHFERPNPRIDFPATPFVVNTTARPWPAGPGPRRAGVSSFGIGGTNAHVILEEAPAPAPAPPAAGPHLLVLSARTPTALDAASARLALHLEAEPPVGLADVAHTLAVGRRAFACRRALVADDVAEAVAILRDPAPGRRLEGPRDVPSSGGAGDSPPPVVFLFPGQGAQAPGAGRTLYRDAPLFRELVDRGAARLRPALGLDLRDLLYPQPGDREAATARLARTEITQPAVFLVAHALARQWMAWGVSPSAMLGHSVGEYVAACLAGVFSEEAALDLVALRGRLMAAAPPGAMLAVALSEAELGGLLDERLAVAAVNGPTMTVAAGPAAAVEALGRTLLARGVPCRPLRTSHAFHSPSMDGVMAPLAEAVARVRREPPTRPWLSGLTGDWIAPDQGVDPGYWARHARETVRFGAALAALPASPPPVFLEVGPGTTLTTLVGRHGGRPAGELRLSSLPREPGGGPDDAGDTSGAAEGAERRHVRETLGRLWVAHVPVAWAEVQAALQPGPRRRVTLPTYPFERQRYWIDPPAAPVEAGAPAPATTRGAPPVPEGGRDVTRWFAVPSWRRAPRDTGSTAPGRPTAWLILPGGPGSVGLTARLEDRLRRLGHQVTRAALPASTDDQGYERLLAGLDPAPARLVHLRTLGLTAEPDSLAEIEAASRLGFHDLLGLAQAFGRRRGGEGLRIDVVTAGLHAVTGREALRPELALLTGPLLTLPREYPGLTAHGIDIPLPDSDRAAALVEDALLTELTAVDPVPLVAYRPGPDGALERWAPEVVPVRLPDPPGDAGPAATRPIPARLRPRGVYLITGGLGGIGLAVAEWLAAEVGARVVLLGRSPFPRAEAWEAWIAEHGEADPVSRTIRRLEALAARGGQALVLAADVADRGALGRALDQARSRFGPIQGLVHAAGVPDGGVIQRRTRADLEAVLAPKVRGTRHLMALLRDDPLDFVVLCSSMAALEGPVGQVAYTAANAFLDAVARARRAAGDVFTVSVAWDSWADAGMAVAARRRLAAAARPGPERGPATEPAHPLLGRSGPVDGAGRQAFVARLGLSDWVLAEHRLDGRPALPATAYLEAAAAACRAATGARAVELRDVTLLAPLVLDGEAEREVHTILERDGRGLRFTIRSRDPGGALIDHATGMAARLEEPRPDDGLAAFGDLADLAAGAAPPVVEGMGQGPRWQTLAGLRQGPGWALALHELAGAYRDDARRYLLHPALLDGALHLLAGTLPDHEGLLPFQVRRLRLWAPLPPRFYAHLRAQPGQGEAAGGTLSPAFDLACLDPEGRVTVQVEGYRLRRAARPGPGRPPAGGGSEPAGENHELEQPEPGRLEALRWRPRPRRAPGPDEVEIEVRAAGLNFKEVLAAAGMLELPGRGLAGLGLECAGTVARVGDGVADLRPGDSVVAFAEASFARFVTTPRALVAPWPAGLTAEEAAGLPVAFTTAYHALVVLGRLGSGERVLVHAAAGGVGLAAVEVARWRGAQVLATAGSGEKRDYLRGLGIAHVFDSRSDAFVDGVREATGGRGVDVVLNSLTGPLLTRGLDTLAPYGRFLELGTRDIEGDAPLSLGRLRGSRSFVAVGIGPDMPGFRESFDTVVGLVAAGRLRPLPARAFGFGEAARAFAHMAQARHVGKVVLVPASIPGTPAGRAVRPGSAPEVSEAPAGWIRPEEGLAALARILAADHPHVLVSPATDPGPGPGPVTGSPRAGVATPGLSTPAPAAPADAAHPRPDLAQAYVAPRGPAEEAVAAVWRTLLGLAEVGVQDDFFELGGNSLLGVQLVAELRHRLGVELPIGSIFENPTVEALAREVTARRAAPAPVASAPPASPPSRRPGPPGEPAPLSFAQEGLWVSGQVGGGSAGYNLPGHLRLTGPLDVGALRRAVAELLARHEILRSAFPLAGGRPVQVTRPGPEPSLPVADLADLSPELRERALAALAAAVTERPLPLAAGPPLRLLLVRLGPAEHVLLLVVHHIAADGWSMGILTGDLLRLYGAAAAGEASPLTPLPLQYADFAAWQRAAPPDPSWPARLDAWVTRLRDVSPVLELPGGPAPPTDAGDPGPGGPAGAAGPAEAVRAGRGSRAGPRRGRGRRVGFGLDPALTLSLRRLASEAGGTLYAVLLAGTGSVLARATGQLDLLLGAPVANRAHRDLDGVVGLFVNTLPVRVDLADNPGFRTLLLRVAAGVREALASQDLPFERLVEALRPPRVSGRNPLVQVLVALQNVPLRLVDAVPAGLRIETFDLDPIPTAFDLMLTALDGPAGLAGTVIHDEAALDGATARLLLAHLEGLLRAAAADPDRPVLDIPLGPRGDGAGPAARDPAPRGAAPVTESEAFDFRALGDQP